MVPSPAANVASNMQKPMSTELFLPGSRTQRWLRVGPLACEFDGFSAWLAAQGYAHKSARDKFRLVRHLSVWFGREGLGAESLDERCFERSLRTRGPRREPTGRAVTGRQLLAHLRCEGRLPDVPEDTDSDDAITRIERTYERFLVNERDLSPATVVNHLPVVQAFLAERFGGRDVALETFVARDANRFIVRHSQRISRSRAKLFATALRSFLPVGQ